MGLQIRDDRQMKALAGLSQDQFNHLLPVFSDIYQATQQKTYDEGITSGTRVRKPGGGCKGKLPTMAEKLLFVLYYYKTYPGIVSGSPMGGLHFAQLTRCHPTTLNACYHIVLRWLSICEIP